MTDLITTFVINEKKVQQDSHEAIHRMNFNLRKKQENKNQEICENKPVAVIKGYKRALV